MLEIPECITISKQMNDTVRDKIIREVKVNQSPHKFAFFHGDIKEYPDMLEGKQISRCVSHGGIIELHAENMRITFNDGAYPRYYEDARTAPKKNQFMILFDDNSCITVTVQMYGGIMVFEEGRNDNVYYKTAVNKPSPLSEEFTFEYFMSLAEGCKDKMSAKAFLATEQRIPGLGNGVLQDILYQAGIHPKRFIKTFSEEDYENLYRCVKEVLEEMTDGEGRDVERDLFGNPGKYLTYLSKKTLFTPCPKCGCEIRKTAYLGGNIYFCEQCQKL